MTTEIPSLETVAYALILIQSQMDKQNKTISILSDRIRALEAKGE